MLHLPSILRHQNRDRPYQPSAEGGSDKIGNAIPVCFECHADIHAYNILHPRGRKFTPDELRMHKVQWLQCCRDHPELFVAASRTADVGPLAALIDELEYNTAICDYSSGISGVRFADDQFRRAIAHGCIATLQDGGKGAVLQAYAAMSAANQVAYGALVEPPRAAVAGSHKREAGKLVQEARPLIVAAHGELLSFLQSEDAPAAHSSGPTST